MRVVDVEALAKDMYVRNVSSYETEPGLVELMWTTEPEVRAFWIAEATQIVKWFGFTA